METNTPFSTEDFQILNKCLDDAIVLLKKTNHGWV